MDLALTEKKVLITGASQGIGKSVAEAFLAEGADVIIIARGEERLGQVKAELELKYPNNKILAMACDCAREDDLRKLNAQVVEEWGGIDIVVANVGDGQSVANPLPDTDHWQRVWDINFNSALFTAREFLPLLQKSNGNLLFISSIAGLEAFGAPTDYSTAKSALVALAKNMARKLAPEVRVNVVAPGNVYFEGGSWAKKIQVDSDKVDYIIQSSVPMKRFGTPKEIADAVLFLSSKRASFITGSTLVVDGGQTVSIF